MMMNTNDILSENQDDERAVGRLSEDEDLLSEIVENLRKGRAHWAEWRKVAAEDFDFYAGTQWSEEDAAKLEEEGRPVVVFNRIIRTINAVAGVEVQNRQEVKYFPRNINVQDQIEAPMQGMAPGMAGMPPNMPGISPSMGGQMPPGMPMMAPPMMQDQNLNDSGFAEVLNEAAKWVRDQCDAEDEESEAFEDCLKCGVGWTETRMDYDDDPQGMIIKDRIDPLTMIVDPNSTKRNFNDAKWVACVKEFTKKEVREMFPGIGDIENNSFWNDEDMLVHDQADEWKYINDYSDKLTKVGMINVVQYQYWRKVPIYIVLTPDGNIVHYTSERYKAAQKMIDKLAVRKIKIMKKVYKQCFLVGNKIAEKSDLGCNHFTFQAMTGLRNRNKNYWFGLITIMKDPQRWANKWLSQIQYILNSNAKGGLLVEEGAVANRRDLEDDWSQPNGIVDLNPGGLAKIKEKQAPQYPDGIDRLLGYAINAINDIPGVNLELIGMAAREQPIGLEMTRKDAGITVLAKFFDGLRRYRKMDGRLLAYYIREYIADGRLIRITGKFGAKYIPLVKDQVAFEYDIIVDDAPTSPNIKEKNFLILMQIIPMALQAGIPVPKEILDYAPLPQDFIQKWKEEIAKQEAASQPTEEQQRMQQTMQQIAEILAKLQVAKAQADVQKTQSETVKNFATAEKDKSVGQEQSALAMQKFGMLDHEQNMKMQNMDRDQSRKDLEMYLNQFRKMLEVELDTQLRSQKNVRVPSLTEIQ